MFPEEIASPTTRTARSAAITVSDIPSAVHIPSPIGYWYYEPVSKSKDVKAVREDDDFDGEDDSARSLPNRKILCHVGSQSKSLIEQHCARSATKHFFAMNNNLIANIDRPSQMGHSGYPKSTKATTVVDTFFRGYRGGGVQIVATSRCIGRTAPVPITMPPSIITPRILADFSPKHRFTYRISVENVSNDQPVQPLGRYWHISEEQHILRCPEDSIHDMETHPPIVIDSPKTGVVGQHPVLHPGQVFEYMSGTDLAAPRGTMTGRLSMAPNLSRARSNFGRSQERNHECHKGE
jgi:uncharacterized protein affecting Mg2+/Co2+ transport